MECFRANDPDKVLCVGSFMMSATRQISNRRELFGASGPELLAATDGEINFLWSFIQGSIMIPETWNALLRNYGFCERHAWIHIAVEMSFREEYLLGPTILYSALVERSLRAVSTRRIIGPHLLTGQLRGTHRCLLCTMNLGSASVGSYPKARLDQGRDGSRLQSFAAKLEPLWRGSLCSDCSGQHNNGVRPKRCRQHLVAAMKAGLPTDIGVQRNMLRILSDRLARYQDSFVVGRPKASNQDRAALIAAIGWCSGWRPLLAQLS